MGKSLIFTLVSISYWYEICIPVQYAKWQNNTGYASRFFITSTYKNVASHFDSLSRLITEIFAVNNEKLLLVTNIRSPQKRLSYLQIKNLKKAFLSNKIRNFSR